MEEEITRNESIQNESQDEVIQNTRSIKSYSINIPEASVELHAQPFLNKNSMHSVLSAIKRNGLDVVALEGIDESIYKKVCEEVRKIHRSGTIKDGAGIRYGETNFGFNYNDERVQIHDKFILNAREYTTKEGFHLLTIGYSIDDAKPKTEIRKLIDEGLKNEALVVVAHPFVDTGRTKTAGHISVEQEKELTDLCKEYPGQITLEWNGYCIPWIREVLMDGLNFMNKSRYTKDDIRRKDEIKYFNVNERVMDFAYSREMFARNIPVVPGTDLHAINSRYLSAIGTSRLWVDVEGETPSDILSSMKTNIFGRGINGHETKFVDEYVGAAHLIGAFGIPVLKQALFGKKSEK